MFCTNPKCPDMQADGRQGEYVDGITECPVCGARLVETLAEDGPTREQVEQETVAVFETADPAEVQVVKSILNGAEIPFVTQGQERFSALAGGHASHRFNPGVGLLTFVVPADLAEEARALLTTVEG